MKFGQKAIDINPKGVEGHYFFGLNVGIYADGVSIVTAIAEGLKGQTQKAFETSCKLNNNIEKNRIRHNLFICPNSMCYFPKCMMEIKHPLPLLSLPMGCSTLTMVGPPGS